MNEYDRKKLIDFVARAFPSFGGGRTSDSNPVAMALKDKPPMFVAGQDISEVVK